MARASSAMTGRFAAPAVGPGEMAAEGILRQVKAPNQLVLTLSEKGSCAIFRGKASRLCHGYLSDFECWQQ